MKRLAARLRAARAEALDRARAVLCALLGHSKLRDAFMWYHTCLRCGDTLGDSLASSYTDPDAVYLRHAFLAAHKPEEFAKQAERGCRCWENVATLTWRDYALVPRFNTWGFATRPPWKPKPGTVGAEELAEAEATPAKEAAL